MNGNKRVVTRIKGPNKTFQGCGHAISHSHDPAGFKRSFKNSSLLAYLMQSNLVVLLMFFSIKKEQNENT